MSDRTPQTGTDTPTGPSRAHAARVRRVALLACAVLAVGVATGVRARDEGAAQTPSPGTLARDLGPTAANPGVPPGPEGANSVGAAAPVVPLTDRPGIIVSRQLTAPGLPPGLDTSQAPRLGTSPSRATALAIPPVGWITRADAARQPNLAAAFDEIDTNRDGMVSPAELSAWQRITGRPLP